MMYNLKRVLWYALTILALVVGCMFTGSWIALPIIVVAIFSAFAKRLSIVIWCCFVLPFVVNMNNYILSSKLPLILCERIGVPIIGVIALLICRNKTIAGRPLPFGLLFAYCLFEVIPSAVGYSPIISYLKLLLFISFVIAVCGFCRCIAQNDRLCFNARHIMLALCLVILLGSICTIPFPAIAYPLSTRWLVREGMSLSEANAQLEITAGTGMRLFAGIFSHSQSFGPVLSVVVCYLLCDMLFLERRIVKFHCILLIVAMICAYMTRSRTALFSLGVTCMMIGCVTVSQVRMSLRTKNNIKKVLFILTIMVVIAALILQFRNGTITKWIRKGNVDSTTYEAVSNSRMGAIMQQVHDFKRSPLFGCGFQVDEFSAMYASSGFALSAPVEKGLLPLVLIGEGGCVGTFIFILFLISFYVTCWKRQLVCTQAGFTAVLATNIGEATFFSPGGVGGCLWVMGIVGCYVIDVWLIKSQITDRINDQYGFIAWN